MCAGLSMKNAVGTSLLEIFLNCIAGMIGHASQSDFDLRLTFLLTLPVVGGIIGGTLLTHRIAARRLQSFFAMFVFAAAFFLLAKNYSVLF